MFHQMPGVSAEDVKSGKCREFTGSGTPHLRVAGLIGDPTAVRVDMVDLPMRLTMRFPDNHLNGQTVHTDMPILLMQIDSDGTPVILRSMISNDGLWQKGHKIFVWGDWEAAADAPVPTVLPVTPPATQTSAIEVDTHSAPPADEFDPAEKLDKATVPQLVALARAAGIEVSEGAAKKDLIATILTAKEKAK